MADVSLKTELSAETRRLFRRSNTYTVVEMEENERLARCKVCGCDCFYSSALGWSHECQELDAYHDATPMNRARLLCSEERKGGE